MRAPLTFEPLFMERVWGGRRLGELYGKALPEGAVIGESWELVDRPEAQSVVASGPLAGATLGELWRSERRTELFGSRARGERFPLLVKLLDCEDTLSVQVHPPAAVASRLRGEPKTETWVVAHASEHAHLFAGLRRGVTRTAFEAALRAGEDVSAMLHRHEVRDGDVMYLPSGRVHAIGGGNVIVEVQQNSDTTYRVFDFNRPGLDGAMRELHVPESLASIDWDDAEPALVVPDGEALVHDDVFEVDRWVLDGVRAAAPDGECAILIALDGGVVCAGEELAAGQLFVVTASSAARTVEPAGDAVTLLRAMLPA
ncbi:MAG TPA: type I phosphomannose isomerase catalytic subunit [Solirubrobacteraceae bacterium]|nr:type I phosphomannose isomerase catalytic subunit [Solirubrobacteraceae bacterium]